MSTSVPNPNKDDESIDSDNWRYCKKIRIGPNSGNSPDGLNGSLHLTQEDRASIGAEGGDPVELRVSANGKIITTERKLVSNGRQVTLPAKKRRELNLEEGDEVEYWIRPIDDGSEDRVSPPTREDAPETAPEAGKQQSLVQEEEEDVERDGPFVLVNEGDNPFRYHHIRSEADQQTVCGIDYSQKEHQTMMDPGSMPECVLCSIDDPEQMDNSQKLAWLGRRGGFVPDRDTAYLTKDEMTSLINYIQEQEKTIQKLRREAP